MRRADSAKPRIAFRPAEVIESLPLTACWVAHTGRETAAFERWEEAVEFVARRCYGEPGMAWWRGLPVDETGRRRVHAARRPG